MYIKHFFLGGGGWEWVIDTDFTEMKHLRNVIF